MKELVLIFGTMSLSTLISFAIAGLTVFAGRRRISE